MHTSTDIYRQIKTYKDKYRHIQTSTDICRQVQAYADKYRHIQTSTDSLTRKPELKFKFSYAVFITKISHEGNCNSNTLAVEDHKRKKS